MDDLQAICGMIGALAAAKPVEVISKLAENVLDGPTKAVGEKLTRQINNYKGENFTAWLKKLVEKAKGRVKSVVTPPPPLSFVVPLLESVQAIDDEELRGLWADLFINASTDTASRHIRFVHLLKELDRADAELFRRFVFRISPLFPDNFEEGQASCDRLLSLGLLEQNTAPTPFGPKTSIPETRVGRFRYSGRTYIVTALGRQFAKAVLIPPKDADSNGPEASVQVTERN